MANAVSEGRRQWLVGTTVQISTRKLQPWGICMGLREEWDWDWLGDWHTPFSDTPKFRFWVSRFRDDTRPDWAACEVRAKGLRDQNFISQLEGVPEVMASWLEWCIYIYNKLYKYNHGIWKSQKLGNIIQSSTPYKYGEIDSQVENPLFAGLTMGSGREGDVADWGNGEGIFYIFFWQKDRKVNSYFR